MSKNRSNTPIDKSLLLDNQLCFAAYAAAHAFNKTYRPLLEPLNLTYPQFLVMLVLWERDGLTVSELAERMFLDSATLTPLLKRLEAAGRLVRRRDVTDQRVVHITLTDDGRRLKSAAASIPSTINRATGLSPSDIATLREDLIALRRGLSSEH